MELWAFTRESPEARHRKIAVSYVGHGPYNENALTNRSNFKDHETCLNDY